MLFQSRNLVKVSLVKSSNGLNITKPLEIFRNSSSDEEFHESSPSKAEDFIDKHSFEDTEFDEGDIDISYPGSSRISSFPEEQRTRKNLNYALLLTLQNKVDHGRYNFPFSPFTHFHLSDIIFYKFHRDSWLPD
ncbi:hypothetical protein AVEN_115859-1 [Araneus ventricosus]|uniref:Uncharacterized protein n=1 Tax=Araneus ventricosus TaxID=182803 RepID=A0A4Y2SNN9_ARAVE|nr:hypothetical protein AVEN_115859-1 [Araneus ventricosus]